MQSAKQVVAILALCAALDGCAKLCSLIPILPGCPTPAVTPVAPTPTPVSVAATYIGAQYAH